MFSLHLLIADRNQVGAWAAKPEGQASYWFLWTSNSIISNVIPCDMSLFLANLT
jgi:hypothetical protein